MYSLKSSFLNSSDIAKKLSLFSGFKVFVSAGTFCTDSSPYEQERSIIAGAVMDRKIEFYSGRYYAREALHYSGVAAQAILRGKKGNPIWPKGILGSITHDQKQVIAAVTHSSSIKGIGIDLLIDVASVEAHLMPLIASEQELFCLAQAFPDIPSLALAFSLKESVVKAVSPNINYYMDMLDIQLNCKDVYVEANITAMGVSLSCHVFPLTKGFITLALLLVY